MFIAGAFEAAVREFLIDVVREVVREELRANQLGDRVGIDGGDSPPASEDRYLSPKKAAVLVGVSPGTIRSWIHEGDLRGYRGGKLLGVRLSELHAFMRRQESHPTKTADEMANQILAQIQESHARRCVTCSHAPSKHEGGAFKCRVRGCGCSRWTRQNEKP
jgi:excisionase family DNA binding protein